MTASFGLLLVIAASAAAAPTAGPTPLAASVTERFERANALYRGGDFAGASGEYEALAADGYTSPALHFNLGNARLRLGQRGPAIVSWERALRLDPWDDDARENLRAARIDDPDRALSGEPELFARLVERTGDRGAVALFAIPWWILWGALALRLGRTSTARRALTALALVSTLGVLAGGALLAGRARDRRLPLAVLIAPSSMAREAPSAALKAAFELHEGTRVRVVGSQGELVRIRLEGGLEGWIARADLELL
jgi:tetratricopeptide (TPR) repeat protein